MISKSSFFILYVLLIAGSLLFVGSCARIFGCIDFTACTSRPNTEAKINHLEITIISDDYSIAFNGNDEADIRVFTSLSNPIPTQVTIKNITLSRGATAIDTSNAPVISGSQANIDSSSGNHRIVLTITAEDGESTHDYTVNIEYVNSDSVINSLEITNSGTDYPVIFDQNYQATINISTSLSNPLPTQVTIKNITLPQGATAVDANNNPVANGSPVIIDSSGGNHRIVLSVTSQDSSSTRDYTVNIVFVNSDSELLTLRLTVNNAEHNIIFDANNQAVIHDITFSWTIPAQVTIQSLTLSPGAAAMDANNNVASNGNMVDVTLDGVNNVVALTVNAEDTITSSNYTITLENTITSVAFGATGTSISAVDFSPDGTRIASASTSPSVEINMWDANVSSDTTTPIATISGHAFTVFTIDYNSDGTKLASGAADNTIKIWDANINGNVSTPIITINTGSSPETVKFNDSNNLIVAGSTTGTITTWDTSRLDDPTPSAPQLSTFQASTIAVHGIDFSPDGSRLISASQDGSIKIWGATATTPIVSFIRHIGGTKSAKFSPDGTVVISVGNDNTVKIWDATQTGGISTPLFTLTDHTSFVRSLAISPDGNTIATGSWDDNIKLWDARTLYVTPRSTPTLITDLTLTSDVISIAFSHDGTKIASGARNGGVKIWR